MTQRDVRRAEEPVRLNKLPGNVVVDLRGLRDSTQRKIAREGEVTCRRIPRQRETAERLPANRQAAKSPDSERDGTERQHTQRQPAQRQQSHGAKTDARGRNRQSTKRKESAEREVADSDPRGDRLVQDIELFTDADVDERQPEQNGSAAGIECPCAQIAGSADL